MKKKKLLFVVNVDWFFVSHRLPLALAALAQGYEVHIATTITNREALLLAHGLVVHPLNMVRNGTHPLQELKSLRELARVMAAVRPDIVHLVTIKPVLFGGVIARWQGVPGVVAAVSGLGTVFTQKGFKANVAQRIVRACYQWVLGYERLRAVFQNPDDRATLIGMLRQPPGKSILVKGSGVDLTEFTPQALPDTSPVFLLAARLLADKGIVEFVDAARQLKKEGLRARFCLVGSPDSESRTSISEVQLQQWASAGDVEVWGQRTDMPAVLAQAHVVVLPSYREGLPRVLLEAAACGRAVITTDVPGCRDAIEPGVTGLLVPARDAAKLATAMRHMAQNPAQFTAMGQAARQLAEHAFSIDLVVAAHLRLYQELLETAP